MIKVSIIVPVYNVEEYIEECIKSLLKQTIDKYEIIIVDDGSKDSSIKKIKKNKSEKVKIISQENRGLSGARNTGLRVAQGEYVLFVDSDDFININTALEDMYNMAINYNSDMIIGNAEIYYTNYCKKLLNSPFGNDIPRCLHGDEFLKYSIKRMSVFVPVWLFMYRRTFLLHNQLFFKEGIYHEDEQFTPRALLCSPIISIYDKPFYSYRQREGSIMNSDRNIKKGYDVLETCEELNTLYSCISDKSLKKSLMNYNSILAMSQIYKYRMTNIPYWYRFKLFYNISSKSMKKTSFYLLFNLKMIFKILDLRKRGN